MAKNTNNNQIFVERETFEKNGRTFFSYQDKHTPRLQNGLIYLNSLFWPI